MNEVARVNGFDLAISLKVRVIECQNAIHSVNEHRGDKSSVMRSLAEKAESGYKALPFVKNPR